jgi:hypothetical protein
MTTEDTQAKENKEMLEEMLRDAKRAGHPSDEPRVVEEADNSTPMVARKESSAGYVYIYDTRTGECSVTNRNMLPAQLEKRRADGSLVFTTKKPAVAPKRGTIKCMLHPDNPNRAHYDALGLPTCRKSNLTSLHQLKQHMRHRHPVEWATIEDERKEAEKAKEREFQRSLLGKVVGKKPQTKEEFVCDVCGQTFSQKIALTGHKRSHNKNK